MRCVKNTCPPVTSAPRLTKYSITAKRICCTDSGRNGLILKHHQQSQTMLLKEVKSLDELKKLRRRVINANVAHDQSFRKLERIAIWITEHVGTMWFFMIILIWTIVWLSWNILAPKSLQFDPFPAFVFWLFISNMIQIFLMPLIMIGQNLQARHSEIRAESDFEVNVKAEREIEAILTHLENQNDLILRLLKHLDSDKSQSSTIS